MRNDRRSRALNFLRRPRLEEEVDAEFAFHIEMQIQLLIDGGMSPADARAEAVRRFGDLAVVAAECRHFGRQRDRSRSRAEYIEELEQDVTFALRQLGRARGFAATAILTLALGIGATAAVFSALYAVVLRPLPIAEPDRVVQISTTRRGVTLPIASGPELVALRQRTDAFSGVAAKMGGGEFTLTGSGIPETIPGNQVTADYFRVLGVSPVLGRGFVASDDVPGAARVVLVSHRLWTHRFASDTSLIGRTLRLNDETFTVIGVLPATYDEAGIDEDMWSPVQLTGEQLTINRGKYLRLTARLAPGVSIARATEAGRAAVQSVVGQSSDAQSVGVVVRRWADVLAGAQRERLLVLFGAVGFVLLIACVNVANLLVARGSVRGRELAIRAALGAGRGRLVRQLLAESLVLAFAGAAVGIAVSYGLVKGLIALAPDDVFRLGQARVNGIVLAFTFAIAVVSSLVAGLLPAVRAASPRLQTTLREGGRASGASRDRIRAALVATEVALAMTLLVGSGLLIRTAWRMQQVDPGFAARRVMTARVALPAARYADSATVTRTFERIRAAAARVPGVEKAALVSVVPMSGSSLSTSIVPEGKPLEPDEQIPVDIRYASPDYFDAMRMMLLDGRDFLPADDGTALPVAIVSAALARRLWPGERAAGKRVDAMRIKGDVPNLMTIVGVVSDVHDVSLTHEAVPTLYMPFTQTPAGMWNAQGRSLVLVARAAPAPESLERALQRAVMTVDPTLPLLDAHSMSSWLSKSVAASRFNMLLLSALGLLALVLASVGVYGVVAYYVSQRTREIGVRIALGATPLDIWELVLGRGIRPLAVGAIVGAVFSLVTARLLRGQLFGVSAGDPTTFASVVATLLGVALVATFVPARRAMRVAPARALASD